MRRRTWCATAIAAGIVLPIAAIGIAAAVLDPNDFKQTLVAAVHDKTGRTLSLNGPIRLSRSLWPTIRVDDVTLANLPGGTRPDMAHAERIEAQLSLPALLHRRIEIAKLTLIGPNILFEQVGNQPNWVFNPPTLPSSPPSTEPGTPFELRIRAAHVQDGMVTWRLPARTKVLGIRSLDLHHPADDGPLDTEAILLYGDNQPFSLKASATPTAGIAGPWTTRLDFAAFDTTAAATGTMDVAGHYDLQIKAQAGALDHLNALLPEMQLPPLHQAALSAHILNGPQPGDLPVIGPARLRFADADLSHRLPGLKLAATSVSLDHAGGPAAISSSGSYAGQPFTATGAVGAPLHPDARGTLPVDIKIQGTPPSSKPASGSLGSGSLAIKGTVGINKLGFDGLDAAATLRTPALAALRPVLTAALPALTGVALDGHLTVPANAASLRLKDASLRSDQGDIAGEATLGLAAARSLQARLQSGTLDLDATLQAFGITLALPSAPAVKTAPIIPDAPLPLSMLHGPTLDIAISIGTLTFLDQAWHGVDLAVQLKNGRLHAGPLKLATPGGPAALTLTADASSNPVPISLELHAPALPLALIARHAGLPGPMTGAARIEAQLHATGHSLRALASTLDGPISVTSTGGQMTNAAFLQLTAAALGALGIHVPAQGETALRCLGVAGSFDHGVARLRTIALETTYLSLAGSGQVDLGRETLALRLNPLAQVSGSAVSVPVVVEGPLNAIAGRLDADAFDKLGLLFSAWLGGDHPTACADAGLLPPSAPSPGTPASPTPRAQ
ncbi:MAG: AsmA family protein [Janthinobacterium lividum]